VISKYIFFYSFLKKNRIIFKIVEMVRNYFKNRLNKTDKYKEDFNHDNNDEELDSRRPLIHKIIETKNYKGEIKNTIKVLFNILFFRTFLITIFNSIVNIFLKIRILKIDLSKIVLLLNIFQD
jgi:hypothetical protein